MFRHKLVYFNVGYSNKVVMEHGLVVQELRRRLHGCNRKVMRIRRFSLLSDLKLRQSMHRLGTTL
jgi:hypothetical protein